MQFLLLIGDDPTSTVPPPEDLGPMTEAWVDDTNRSGVRSLGSRLRPTTESKSVRMRNRQLIVSDGPFAESNEQIAGFDLIECSSLEEALDVAARHPVAGCGVVEVRPLWTD